MILVTCPACGRKQLRENLFPRNARVRCSNCGALGFKQSRHIKAWMVTDVEGMAPAQARERTLSGLVWLAEAQGYKWTWAVQKYRKLFQEEPPNFQLDNPQLPYITLVAWCITERARYAAVLRKMERGLTRGSDRNHDEVGRISR